MGEGGKTRDCFMAKRRGGAERYEGRSSFHRAFLHESTRQTCFTCSVRFRVYINIRVGITYSGVFSLLSLEITSIVEPLFFSFLVSGFGPKRGERVNKKEREESEAFAKRNFRGMISLDARARGWSTLVFGVDINRGRGENLWCREDGSPCN